MTRAGATAVCLAVGLAVTAVPAHAYEFAVRARSIGQAHRLRVYRPLTGNFAVDRRRFTQTLTLNIWNIGEGPRSYSLWDTRDDQDDDGPELYITGYLRIDHDFGDYVGGDIVVDGAAFEAADLIPEIDPHSLGFDLLWGYAGARGIAGFLDVELGRKLVVDQFEWWSFDGATVRAHTPWRFALEAFGGARVRESSPLGSVVHEPDGTAGSECFEYVEGTGSWRPIDTPGSPFAGEFDLCPQRAEWMPTFGGAIETAKDLAIDGRVSYRRSVSRSPGVIGDPNRFTSGEDVGFYPNEQDQAPAWGVNEERVSATVRGTFGFAREEGRVTPFAGTRYSLLHGLFDQHLAGVRLTHGAHTISPEYYYAFPTFDGDSIFNVFSTSSYHDARITYELSPAAARWTAYARTWLRRFGGEPAEQVTGGDTAGGGQLGGVWRAGRKRWLRADGFYEDGYGGLRTGGTGAAQWALGSDLDVTLRLSAIYFDDDLRDRLDGLTLGAQLGGTYVVNDGIAMHLLLEENSNDLNPFQFRAIALLDLAFQPEI